jgi:hypothetical protein
MYISNKGRMTPLQTPVHGPAWARLRLNVEVPTTPPDVVPLPPKITDPTLPGQNEPVLAPHARFAVRLAAELTDGPFKEALSAMKAGRAAFQPRARQGQTPSDQLRSLRAGRIWPSLPVEPVPVELFMLPLVPGPVLEPLPKVVDGDVPGLPGLSFGLPLPLLVPDPVPVPVPVPVLLPAGPPV